VKEEGKGTGKEYEQPQEDKGFMSKQILKGSQSLL
jgi:hypothetical protein